jgi:general stress protein 26
MEARHDQAAEQKVFDLVKDIQVAQMVTVDKGKLRSRPMVARVDQAADELWFFTSVESGKIRELEANNEVLLTYSDPSRQNYVSIEGEGEVVRGPQKVKELWSEPMRVWFPKGPTDPDIALVKVKMREATYWDAPSSAFVYAYGYAKAMATGERPHPGDVGHVEIHRQY